jgi:hypothetical protein
MHFLVPILLHKPEELPIGHYTHIPAPSRQSAQEMRGAGKVAGLGRNVGVMPDWEFFRLVQKYGHKEVHSREFLKHFQKNNPDLVVHKL